MRNVGFTQVDVATSTRSWKLESPDTFWEVFNTSAPPLAYLFKQLGTDATAAVGREYMEILRANSPNGIPTLTADVCIGVGRR
jgi:hypothetical protein